MSFLKICIFFFLFVVFGTFYAQASESYFTSILKIKSGYDDNIAFTYKNRYRDFFGVLSPNFYINYKNKRSSFISKLGISVYRYAKYKHLDTTYQHYEAEGNYSLTERWQFYGQTFFIKDTTLESELKQTGVIHVRSTRKRYKLALGTKYLLNELSQVNFDVSGSRTEYAWKYNMDYNLLSLSTTYQKHLKTQRDVVMSKIYYTYIDSKASKVKNNGILMGWKHLFSETVNLSAFVGARYTLINYYIYYQRVIFNPLLSPPFQVIVKKINQTSKEWDYLADVAINIKGERNNYTLGMKHNLTYSSFGEPVNRTLIFGNVFYKWSPRWVFSIWGGYYITRSKGGVYKEDNRFWSIHPVLKYFWKKYWFWELSYTYSRFNDRIRNHIFDRNQIFISLNFMWGEPPAIK